MVSQLSAVIYGADTQPVHQTIAVSALGFAATVTRLKQALEEQDLWLIHEIDPQMLLKREGYESQEARQLLFFHPRLMVKVLAVTPDALIEAPLKIVIMKMQDGKVTVRFSNLEPLLSRYHGFSALIEELTAVCTHLLQSVAIMPTELAAAHGQSTAVRPPFTEATARAKARMAEDAWNSRDPERVVLAYTEDSQWRNRNEFFRGRESIKAFLKRKWSTELDYRLIKEVWAFHQNRISVRFAYEWHNQSGNWFRSYGNENWEFNEHGLMQRRIASINDLPIVDSDRRFHWPLGRRPEDHPGLSELGL